VLLNPATSDNVPIDDHAGELGGDAKDKASGRFAGKVKDSAAASRP
jgi:hypothetical protein